MRASSGSARGFIAIGLATLAMGLDGGLVWWLVLRAIAGVASALVLITCRRGASSGSPRWDGSA